LNPKQSILIKWKNKLFVRNLYVIPNVMKRASSAWNEYQTYVSVKNWWKKLDNHESNSFSPKKYRKFVKKATTQSTSDLSTKHQTSEISLNTSDLMLKHQKWQHCTPTDDFLVTCHSTMLTVVRFLQLS